MSTRWIQELGDREIIPDEVQRGELDRLGAVLVGAYQHRNPIRVCHTIGMWWPSHTLPAVAKRVLQETTSLSRPGSHRRGLLWTNNPDHHLSTEDPLLVDELTTVAIMQKIYMILAEQLYQGERMPLEDLEKKAEGLMREGFNGARHLPSLREAGVYDYYSGEFRGTDST